MKTLFVLGLSLVVAIGTFSLSAFAAGPPVPPKVTAASAGADLTQPEKLGGCSDVPDTSGYWKWGHVKRVWTYWSGGTGHFYADFYDSGMWCAFGLLGEGQMFTNAATSRHWVGIYWTSSSSWSNMQYWYY